MASNSLHHVIRDAHGPSEATVCITVKKVVRAINAEFVDEVVNWPQNCDHLAQHFLKIR